MGGLYQAQAGDSGHGTGMHQNAQRCVRTDTGREQNCSRDESATRPRKKEIESPFLRYIYRHIDII